MVGGVDGGGTRGKGVSVGREWVGGGYFGGGMR